MAAVIETLITCDGGGENCEGTFAEGDSRHETAAQQRADFPDHGWHYYRGKDYCPACFLRQGNHHENNNPGNAKRVAVFRFDRPKLPTLKKARYDRPRKKISN